MRRFFTSVLIALLIIALTLAAMFSLVRVTIAVARVPSPLLRAISVGLELILGIALLLGTVYIATHLAVRIYGASSSPPRP